VENTSRVIVALDFPREETALTLLNKLDPTKCRIKIGKEIFTRKGPQFVNKVIHMGFDVFLDLKYHDIPNTVAAACDVAADLGVWMMNVHASGGRKMMEAAMDKLAHRNNRPLVVGVTILTSLDGKDIHEIGYDGTPADNVLNLAGLAQSSGLDGVVCSPKESLMLRESIGDIFELVTPGIRFADGNVDDQKRIMTPGKAISAGSSYLIKKYQFT
jgi:orotidine-5'-phosphate decarboxylase